MRVLPLPARASPFIFPSCGPRVGQNQMTCSQLLTLIELYKFEEWCLDLFSAPLGRFPIL